MTPKEMAEFAAKIAEDKKAADISVLEISDITIIADYFVICTCSSTTHVKTVADEIEFKLKQTAGIYPHHVEGYESKSWILLDYSDIIVHLFLKDTRDFYSIERLWSDARKVDIN